MNGGFEGEFENWWGPDLNWSLPTMDYSAVILDPASIIGEIPSTVLPEGFSPYPGVPGDDDVARTWEELRELFPDLFEPILETRPGRIPDPYPQDVAVDDVPEDDEVAHTWGHIAREFLGGIINPVDTGIYNPPEYLLPSPAAPTPLPGGGTMASAGCDGMAWAGGVPPKGYKVVNHCGVGVLRKIRRRRRRRMLTASDASDLATIVGIVGKGQMASSMINRTRS